MIIKYKDFLLENSNIDLLRQSLINQIDYYKKTENKSPLEINKGLCEDVSYDVIEELGGETSTLFEMNDGWFWDIDKKSKYKTKGGEFWNVKNLNKYGKPKLSWEEMSKFDLCGHSWIYYNSKHYDVECLDGVSNFWDLPIFKRWIKKQLVDK